MTTFPKQVMIKFEQMSSLLQSFANSSFLNIVGGCCGTTPEHIAAIYTAIKLPARTLIEAKGSFTVSGLETFTYRPKDSNFIMVGERQCYRIS